MFYINFLKGSLKYLYYVKLNTGFQNHNEYFLLEILIEVRNLNGLFWDILIQIAKFYSVVYVLHDRKRLKNVDISNNNAVRLSCQFYLMLHFVNFWHSINMIT